MPCLRGQCVVGQDMMVVMVVVVVGGSGPGWRAVGEFFASGCRPLQAVT